MFLLKTFMVNVSVHPYTVHVNSHVVHQKCKKNWSHRVHFRGL